MTTATERINEAIAESGGSVRDALNVALAQRDTAMELLEAQRDTATMLLEAGREQSEELLLAMGTIKTILGIGLSPKTTVRAIDKAARELGLSGQIPTCTTKED